MGELLNPDVAALAHAEASVADARVALADAEAALSGLIKPGAFEVAQAEVAVANSQTALAQARDVLETLASPGSEFVAQAIAKVTDARLDHEDAQTNLEELRAGASEDDIAVAQFEVDLAATSLANVRLDLRLITRQWDDALSSAIEAVSSAEDEYRIVILKWLGIELSEADVTTEPETLLQSWGADLVSLFDSSLRFTDINLGWFDAAFPANDPDTPWDESVVYTWLNLYPEEIGVTCADGSGPTAGVCIADEIDDTWEVLASAVESLDTVGINATKARSNAQSAVDKASNSLVYTEDALAELVEPADALDLEAAQAHADLAVAVLQTAEEELAEIEGGPAQIEFVAAERQVALAEADRAEATQRLAELLEPDALDIEAKTKQVALAQANLEEAQAELATLIEPGPLNVAATEQQVSVARALVDDAMESLAEMLAGPGLFGHLGTRGRRRIGQRGARHGCAAARGRDDS